MVIINDMVTNILESARKGEHNKASELHNDLVDDMVVMMERGVKTVEISPLVLNKLINTYIAFHKTLEKRNF